MKWQDELDKITFDRDFLRNDNGNMLFKDEVIPIITSQLKRQRDNCAVAYINSFDKDETVSSTALHNIKNASEPE